MICYLCKSGIPEDQPFYNDYEQYVCKPCFLESPRCWICRFPGKALQEVEGLGMECEFCRGNLISPEHNPAEIIRPATTFLANFGLEVPVEAQYHFTHRDALKDMQIKADLPPDDFIDDFLRTSYPVFFAHGKHHCLRRMTRETLITYGIVQMAAASICDRAQLASLAGDTPFHSFCRGFSHYIGYEASQRLGFDLETRQLRKWPEMGLQGDFERWQAMGRFRKPAYMGSYFKAHFASLARKHLS